MQEYMKSTTYVGVFFKSENCQACQSKTRRKALKIFLPRSAKFVCCRCYDSYDLYGARTKVCRVLLFRELFVSSDECQAGARLETCAALTNRLRHSLVCPTTPLPFVSRSSSRPYTFVFDQVGLRQPEDYRPLEASMLSACLRWRSLFSTHPCCRCPLLQTPVRPRPHLFTGDSVRSRTLDLAFFNAVFGGLDHIAETLLGTCASNFLEASLVGTITAASS